MKKISTIILLFAFSIATSFGQTAPDFTFTDIEGESHTLSEALAEGKVIMLDFFFINCPPCISLAPDIDQLITDYEGTTLEIWALSDRDQDAAISSSIFHSTHAHHKVGGIQGGGADVVNLYANNFNFTGFPTYAIVCSDGSITWDVWPVTAGLPELRALLTEDCGVTELVSGVADIQELKEAGLYPNPATDNVAIDFKLTSGTTMSLAVYNTVGQQVKSVAAKAYSTGDHSINLDVSNLSTGLYIVKMQSNEGVKSLDLVITK